MDIDLTMRKSHPDYESYSISFDGVPIGSISFREDMGVAHESYWEWSVSTMPMIGGATPGGRADSLEEAKREFRSAFERWIETVPADDWAKNREYIKYTNRPDRYSKQRPAPRGS